VQRYKNIFALPNFSPKTSIFSVPINTLILQLIEISEQTADSHVVRQQMAKVFGMRGSDLVAANNLIGSRSTISRNSSNYANSMAQLYKMAGSMYSRTGMGEMLSNA
jgi:hypothetical protein